MDAEGKRPPDTAENEEFAEEKFQFGDYGKRGEERAAAVKSRHSSMSLRARWRYVDIITRF